MGGPISSQNRRINDRIRVPEVRLVGPEGEQVGIVPIGKAWSWPPKSDLDLVEVAPMARPPVCKLMDYGKFKYENAQKAREARRNQGLDRHQGNEATAQDRPARLRDQEGSRRAVPEGRATRSRSRSCSVAVSSRGPSWASGFLQRLAEDITGTRFRGVLAETGRTQHGHGRGPAPGWQALADQARTSGRRRATGATESNRSNSQSSSTH